MLLWSALGLSGLFMMLEMGRVNKFISRFLAITPLFFLFVMLAFNRLNLDYPFYSYAFIDDAYREKMDFGYAFLVEMLSNMGKDHTTIVLLAGSLFLFTLFKMLKTSNHINLVIFFYCAFPLIFDLNQIRNLLMYLIVILSLVFVEKKKPIKHYAMLFIAFSLHKFALVYVPFYYFTKMPREKFIKSMVRLTLIVGASSLLILKVLTMLYPVKMGFYLSRPPGLGVTFIFLYAFVDIFTVWWVDKKISVRADEEEKRKLETLYRFVWFPLLILPFAFYFIEVSRMQRNALLVKYIYCALAMKHLSVKEKLFALFLLVSSIALYLGVVAYTNRMDLFQFLDENELKYFLDKYLF